jgi:hypothetical protein
MKFNIIAITIILVCSAITLFVNIAYGQNQCEIMGDLCMSPSQLYERNENFNDQNYGDNRTAYDKRSDCMEEFHGNSMLQGQICDDHLKNASQSDQMFACWIKFEGDPTAQKGCLENFGPLAHNE